MKKLTTLLLFSLSTYSIHAQNLIPAYQNRANQVSQTNITANLQDFSNLGIKTTGSLVNTTALNWLKSKYESYGYSATQMTEDPFSFDGPGSTTINSKNLIITKTGTVYPNQYVVICAHYDTIVGPGVSDNGSGTSILLEAARILKDIPTEYSIKFIHFSGEEQGLFGSYHYADNVAYQGTNRLLDIKLVFNIDQVGGKIGNVNNTIKCERDVSGQSGNNAASNTVTQELATCTSLYSSLQTSISPAYSSDYIPFEQKGYTITGFYEYTKSNNEHTINDTFANIDPTYVYNVGKATVGALQHFAVASSALLAVGEVQPGHSLESVKVYPNPAKDILNIELPKEIKHFAVEISDMNGRSIIHAEDERKINASKLVNGLYMVTIKTDTNSTTRKVIIEK